MTAEEEQQLRDFSASLAQAEQSRWEPQCVCKAFASKPPGALVLTMQGWIDLEAVHSPLLEGALPDGENAVEQLSAARAAFMLPPEEMEPHEVVAMAEAMRAAVHAAFAMQLKMKQPGTSEGRVPGGFGAWLPIYACLIGQIGMTRSEARSCPVVEAFAVIAAHRRNQGWTVADKTYAQRDADAQPQNAEEAI